ncbi:MAG: thioesterase family protein [Aeromicrobium sp.]
MSTTPPSYDQVVELPAQISQSVPAEFIDDNGHMNIGRYLQLGGQALWKRSLADLGMGASYIHDRGMSTFTAEHHLQYFSELLEGNDLSVRVRLLERSDRVFHAVSLVVDETQRRLACVVETTIVHIDMTTRRPTAFPDDIATLLDVALKADALDWSAPVCGAMGVRRRA